MAPLPHRCAVRAKSVLPCNVRPCKGACNRNRELAEALLFPRLANGTSSPHTAAVDEAKRKRITIHTDGGCEGNPGPGGWAAILRYGEHMREVSGCDVATTNNRMELQAAIGALEALKQECDVDLYTDSQYLRRGVTEWLPMWKKRGWRTVDKKPVRNQDLWQRLDRLTGEHVIRWHWLKGHAGHRDNERCDTLAQAEIAKLHKQFTRAQLKQAKAAFRLEHEAPSPPPPCP